MNQVAFSKYQVTFDETGEVESTIQLPAEPAKRRVIIVREETPNKARQVAEKLYSLAE
jgi:hypothetical protein